MTIPTFRQSRTVGLGMGRRALPLIEIIKNLDHYEFAGVATVGPEFSPRSKWVAPVIGAAEKLEALRDRGISSFFVVNEPAQDSFLRKSIFGAAVKFGFEPVTLVSKSAKLSPSAQIRAGSAVLASAIIGPNCVLGKNVTVCSGSILEHDCVLFEHCHIGSGSHVEGGVSVGEGTVIGSGVHVCEGVKIGENVIISEPGSIISSDVPSGTIVRRSESNLGGSAVCCNNRLNRLAFLFRLPVFGKEAPPSPPPPPRPT
jgi:acetyltransferase-like isoleucine patch superfamily enzyme